MKKVTLIILLFAVICAVVLAETESLDLQQCLALAEENSLDLQNALMDLQERNNEAGNKWNLYVPDISATAGLSDSASLLEQEEGRVQGSYGFSLSHTLIPGKRQLSLQRDWALEVAELKFESIRRQLRIDIEDEFYYLLTARSNIEIKRSNLELARKRYEQSQIKFQNGLTSELDVLQQRVNAANLEPDFNAQEAAYRHRLSRFLQDLGLDPSAHIDLSGSLEEEFLELPEMERLLPFLDNRSDIKISRINVELSQSSLSMSKSSNLGPKATLSASWSQNFSELQSGTVQDSDTGRLSLQLSLGLTSLLPGSKSQLTVDSMENALIKAQRDLEEQQQDARLELANVLDSLETDKERVEISRLNLELAERSYEMTETHYNLGKSDRLTVEDAQQKLLTARQNMLESQYQYVKDKLMLRQVLGLDSLETLEERK